MTFFEAWEKAKNGDKLIWRNKDYTEITKKNSAGLQDLVPDQNKGPYFVLWLLEKEWIIIPKKKTVEIEIPEGAKNITISYSEGSPASVLQSCGISKITYET